MPYVRGFLKVGRRHRPGRPDIGLPEEPEGEIPVDPDYGIEEGGNIDNELPDPPPGIWPPLTPEQPWRPIPSLPERPGQGLPGGGPTRPGQGLPGEPPEVTPPIVLPPGVIWPPLPPDVHGKFLALVLIGSASGFKYRYVVIDADAKPPRPGRPEHPIAPGGPDTPTPKR